MLGIIGTGALVYTRSFASRQDAPAVAEAIAAAISHAETQARAVMGDSSWGVKINTGEIVVFKGSSYINRVATSDEKIKISNAAEVSGITEIVFSKVYGYPNVSGNINIKSGEVIKIISINAKGIVTK